MVNDSKVKDIHAHSVKNKEKILEAMKIQDDLRRKTDTKESTEIIREWREARCFSNCKMVFG